MPAAVGAALIAAATETSVAAVSTFAATAVGYAVISAPYLPLRMVLA